MPLKKIVLKPGINRDQTNYAGEGGWYAGDKVRFFSGFPQKIGGWVKYSSNAFAGTCRSLFNWTSTASTTVGNYLALGTSDRVYVEYATTINNITPLRPTTPSVAVTNITTTVNSSVVQINFAAVHSVTTVGNYVTFTGFSFGTYNGVTAANLNSVNGFKIVAIISTTALTIDSGEIANATGSGGGTGTGYFEIDVGANTTASGYGWGVPDWGGGTSGTGWGTPTTTPSYIPLRLVYFDKYVDDLFFNIRFGQIYYWNLTNTFSTSTRAVLLSSLSTAASVPTQVTQILFDTNANILMAFGAVPYYGSPPVPEFDPLLIRWASQANYLNWAPSDDPGISTAGYLRVQTGSQILRAVSNLGEIVVFTESSVTSVQYTATFPLLFAQKLISNDVTLIGPNALTAVNNVIYWMGHDKFFMYNGRVESLPTTLRAEVFENIEYKQAEQFFATTNERFNEIWWFYCSSGASVIDRYVVYNYVENVWHYGTCSRSLTAPFDTAFVRDSWSDSPLRVYPQAAAEDGYLYNHEIGTDANGESLPAYLSSADFDIDDGNSFSLIRRIIPDVSFTGSTYGAQIPVLNMTILPRDFPGDPYDQYNAANQNLTRTAISLVVNQFTEQVFVRARARQMAISISSDALGTAWQLGAPRADIRQDGTRGYNNTFANIIYWNSQLTDGADTMVALVDILAPPAPLLFLDASNASSWPYAAGAAPSIATWTDISGSSYYSYPEHMDVYNNPALVTISGSTKGLRMQATTGGTYPNGTAVLQRGEMDLGGDPSNVNGDVGTLLTASKSYSISMWICFNQAPIAGSGSGGQDFGTSIFAQFANNAPSLILASSRGDSVQPRYLNEIGVQYYSNGPSAFAVAGTWVPTVGVWYLVTIVGENTSSSSGTLNLYINDALQGTSTITGASYVPFNLPAGNYYTYNFVLNEAYYPNASPIGPPYFGGDITFSTFKIWNSVLTPGMVNGMFNTEKTSFGY